MTQAGPAGERTPLAPLSVLVDTTPGVAAPLPDALTSLYGRLAFPADVGRPWVISNFVSSIDGVVAFNDPVPLGQGEISASNPHDRAVMGLLRAMADAVIVGAGTLRAVPRHLWAAEYIYPPLTEAYAALRVALGKPPAPLTVIVSASGEVDTTLPVFQQPDAPTLLLTTADGAARLAGRSLGPRVRVLTAAAQGSVSARATLDAALLALSAVGSAGQPLLLVEGGPRLLTRFVAEGLLDEQFLTIAPQLVGRDDQFHRPGLIEGQRLAPEHPQWARLLSARQADSYLFLRYTLAAPAPPTSNA